ncbi:hypothetical protein L914_04577 [Phytophthora nicotianae]|uniref:Uncharacterized protein n=1 Tax=Phytophthora nicotianae TaxID=4792 RepID=W2NSM7_PHYNI|nr:hypothetical protein L914_04577 [Phytophthora nicotianae]
MPSDQTTSALRPRPLRFCICARFVPPLGQCLRVRTYRRSGLSGLLFINIILMKTINRILEVQYSPDKPAIEGGESYT